MRCSAYYRKTLKQLRNALLFACLTQTGQAALESGPAPNFTLTGEDGSELNLADQQGHVVMINFWASWCGPCRQEMPHLNTLAKAFAPQGFKLLGVNVDEDPNDAIHAMKALNIEFPVLFDSDNTVVKLFDIDAMPTTVIIDRDGHIRYLHRGYKPGYEDDYHEQVSALIRE